MAVDVSSKLGELLANKGVPPFILANNISVDSYQQISLYKRDGFIIVDMVCLDPETEQLLEFRYQYDKNEVLLRKEMTVAGKTSLIWDREMDVGNHDLRLGQNSC